MVLGVELGIEQLLSAVLRAGVCIDRQPGSLVRQAVALDTGLLPVAVTGPAADLSLASAQAAWKVPGPTLGALHFLTA